MQFINLDNICVEIHEICDQERWKSTKFGQNIVHAIIDKAQKLYCFNNNTETECDIHKQPDKHYFISRDICVPIHYWL